MRVFVGDIQGCFSEFKEIVSLIQDQVENPEIYCVGDLVNRGPASAEVLRFMIDQKIETVLGNHDLHLLGLADEEDGWRDGDTVDDVLEAEDGNQLLDWLRQRPLYLEWDDLILVHAGWPSHIKTPKKKLKKLEEQIASGHVPWDSDLLRFVTTVRYANRNDQLSADRERSDEFRPWDEFYEGSQVVVCGHWAARGLYMSDKIRSLDTGCVWGGALTAWVAENDSLISVPARKEYCIKSK